MISDLHSRQFFAKHFTKTQKFGVEGVAPTLSHSADGGRGPKKPTGLARLVTRMSRLPTQTV